MTCQVSSNFKITFRDSSVTDDPCAATVLPATCQGHQFPFLLCGQKALLAEPLILGNDTLLSPEIGALLFRGASVGRCDNSGTELLVEERERLK